ncbi:MAG: hypothetical protein GY869_26240 [Planctomycetes bacterium]|nr:hypothetical protein [Planctomycetota bacterium]
MDSKPNQPGPESAVYFVGVVAWLIPGAGHWLLGMRQRAVIIFVTICSTFLIGLVLGSIELIDPQHAKAWFCAQILTGFPAIIATLLQDSATTIKTISGFARGVDIGQVYAGVAGLLNLICILDALLRSQQLTTPVKAATAPKK